MPFSYQEIAAFAPLAWVARREHPSSPFQVTHGRHVETQPAFFVEGAWSGPFGDGGLDACDAVFGSGARDAGEVVTFVGCTATTDFIYYAQRERAISVSNSLPLLLAVLDDALRDDDDRYSAINLSVIKGIRHYEPRIPTRDGEVRRVVHANVVVTEDGIRLVDKPLPPAFASFADYRDLLRDRIGKLVANARDPMRRRPLHVFSTQSKGYDTTAVNAIAAPFGVEKVFTSPESKERHGHYDGVKGDWPSDDGRPICEILGLPCVPIERTHFERALEAEHWQWAGLDNNQDLNLHEIQAHLTGPTLLLTGNLGEIWYTRKSIGEARLATFNDELIRWDHAGHGMGEVRLKAGFVQVAVPFIGARHREAILRITESEEMAPYTLGTKYDRPIPRRIGEEAGIAREMFGQVKMASVVHLPSPNLPVTRTLRDEFLRHLRRRRLVGRVRASLLRHVQRYNSWVHWKEPTAYLRDPDNRLLYYAARLWQRASGRPLELRPVMTALDSYLYAFCVNKVRDEYRAVLQPAAAPADRGRATGTRVSAAQRA